MVEQAKAPEWIEALFSRLMVNYGQEWRTMWAGIDPLAVQRDWYGKLWRIHEKSPKAIKHALENLPERVPTADKFRALCLTAPSENLALPAPVSKPSKGFAEAILARIKAAQDDSGLPMGEQCARRLEAKIAAGQKLSFPQRAQLEAIRRMGSQGYNAADVAQELDELKRVMAAKVAAYESAA